VRGRENVHKKLLIQAAACNLAQMLRARYGSGKPKAAHDKIDEVIFVYIWLIIGIRGLGERVRPTVTSGAKKRRRLAKLHRYGCDRWK
jgi:hypothetical protein